MKALREMTRAEIERAADKAHKASSALIAEMIAAGRGTERPSQTALKNDDLSRRYLAAFQTERDIADECRRRMDFQGNIHRTLP